MHFYGWTPRQLEDFTLEEIAGAFVAMNDLRGEQHKEAMLAHRVAQYAKPNDFKKAVS